MRKALPSLALLAGSILALMLAVLVVGASRELAGFLLALGVLGSVGAEVLVWRTPTIGAGLRRLQADATFRAGLRDVLLVAVAASAHDTGTDILRVTGGTVVLVWACRLLTILAQRRSQALRAVPVSWRNFEVPGVRRSEPLGTGALSDAVNWPSSGTLVLAIALSIHLLGATATIVVVAAVVSAAIALATALVAVIDYFRARRDTPLETVVDLLGAALAEYAPRVALYYSRPEPIGYIANVWVQTLEQLPQRTVVICREAYNAELVETDRLPVIEVRRAGDLERVIPPSLGLALYPSNVAKNNHLLRLPGIFDVFIGHGDSDKGGSATVLTRIFDEAWVSGPAARDRYRIADVGVLDEQIREVGRPQLAEIERHAAPLSESHAGTDGVSNWDYTVLYAPTREGFFAAWEYSSILAQGEGILTGLLGMPGVRVLFKPHPGTGTDDPAYRIEVERLTALVEAAGAPHEVVTGAEGLYHAFNRADLLVSDVSSVITDFLASGKPYVVTNSGTLDEDAFRELFPSAQGAYILSGSGSDVTEHVADAIEHDSHSAARRRTTEYLLGDSPSDPVTRFVEAVDTVLAKQQQLTADHA
jgi:hypothetical protein